MIRRTRSDSQASGLLIPELRGRRLGDGDWLDGEYHLAPFSGQPHHYTYGLSRERLRPVVLDEDYDGHEHIERERKKRARYEKKRAKYEERVAKIRAEYEERVRIEGEAAERRRAEFAKAQQRALDEARAEAAERELVLVCVRGSAPTFKHASYGRVDDDLMSLLDEA